MLRRTALSSSAPLRGGPRPWKKRNMPIAIHQSQRPPAPSNVDFDALGLQFKITHDTNSPKIIRTMWSEKPIDTPNLPFMVDRTAVGNQIPVYIEIKAGGTKVVTMIRKIRGDAEALKKDMELVCGKPVTIKPGKLQVDGNYSLRLKRWLTGLGF